MINVAIRFDDPSITSNHALEEDVISICSQYGVKINFAVIPYKNIENKLCPLTPLAARHLVDAEAKGLIEVSQHGHSHQNNSLTDNSPSEFNNLPYEDQLHLITTGKEILDGIFGNQDRGLVPPWNSFDNNTLLAAKKLGFTFISGGWKLPVNYRKAKIKIIPRTGQATNLMIDVHKYRAYSLLSPTIIAVLHHYDFAESNETNAKFDLNEFEEIIKNITSTPYVRVTSLDSIATNSSLRQLDFGHASHQFLADKLNWRLQKFLPTPLFFKNSLKKWP